MGGSGKKKMWALEQDRFGLYPSSAATKLCDAGT